MRDRVAMPVARQTRCRAEPGGERPAARVFGASPAPSRCPEKGNARTCTGCLRVGGRCALGSGESAIDRVPDGVADLALGVAELRLRLACELAGPTLGDQASVADELAGRFLRLAHCRFEATL